MKQLSFFKGDKEKLILLPKLEIGPIKYSIGIVSILIRKEVETSVLNRVLVQISPRIKEPAYILENGETIIITSRKKVNPPEHIDGILENLTEGGIRWQFHKKIEKVQKEIEKVGGIAQYSKSIPNDWANNFRYKAEAKKVLSSSDYGIRPPQLGALHAVGAHWSINLNPATLVMPTGTGKTETMLAVQFANQLNKILVAVPSKALRSQIANKFSGFGILENLGVVVQNPKYPVVGTILKRPKSKEDLHIFNDCNICIGVVSSLSGGTASTFLKEIANLSQRLIIDEAHHVAAKTWAELKQAFKDMPVLQFTATPFRNDGKLVGGSVIYNYPLRRAQEDGYFKKINFHPVNVIDYEAADGPIAKKAIEILRNDIDSKKSHQIIARCKQKERAEIVFKLYQELAPDLFPILIHSDTENNARRIQKVRSGACKIVVCVDMLGEGIDIPSLKIAAIHDLHKSLGVLLQFTGRITRSGPLNLGEASVVANIANPKVHESLEALYAEDADWNFILKELSSSAAKSHAALIKFLEESTPYNIENLEDISISENSLRPTFSTLFYTCTSFKPKDFVNGLSDKFDLINVWINDNSNTLYFVTRAADRVKWTRTKDVKHIEWDLFVLHYDKECSLLYLASTNKSASHESLAKSVGGVTALDGENMFRSLGQIGRLVFNNLGVTKHGRKNLSFAMYTGADVKQALSETEKKGSRKSNISGYGWEFGEQITIGCSYKGRVWSKAAGTIPEFIDWANNVGKKLLDDSIDTKAIISNVLIPEYAESIPEYPVLCIEWPVEILSQHEDRVSISYNGNNVNKYEAELVVSKVDRDNNTIYVDLITEKHRPFWQYKMIVKGEEGYEIEPISGDAIVKIGRNEGSLLQYFSDYPPLVRFIDLSELDGNILLKSEDSGLIKVDEERLIVWDWTGTKINLESIWKNGEKRNNTVQEKVAEEFITAGFSLVYDDDDAGEAADLICLKEEGEHIRLVLIHCKFSGTANPGKRVSDVVEVSSQAVRSARWPGKFKELIRHIQNREKRHLGKARSGFLKGSNNELEHFLRLERFKHIRPEIMIVQPGVQKSKITEDQSVVLGSAVDFIKQTLGVDIDIVCSV